jgi:hypothetical protein
MRGWRERVKQAAEGQNRLFSLFGALANLTCTFSPPWTLLMLTVRVIAMNRVKVKRSATNRQQHQNFLVTRGQKQCYVLAVKANL